MSLRLDFKNFSFAYLPKPYILVKWHRKVENKEMEDNTQGTYQLKEKCWSNINVKQNVI